MTRINNTKVIVALLAAVVFAQSAHAQSMGYQPMGYPQPMAYAQPMAQQPTPVPAQPAITNGDPLLPGFPHTPDVPNSLMQPGTSQRYTCEQPECPYFQRDARLDPDELGQPGWLADMEADLANVHVVDKLIAPVNGSNVDVPMAALHWTVSPRVEVGYRLPSGFGEFDFSYKFMFANGSSAVTGGDAAPDGPASVTSLFRLNTGDFDYASNESSLWPSWNMKWRIGLRAADVLFSSTADESLAAAAGGSGVFERAIRDEFYGLGPHAALELKHPFGDGEFSLVGRLDGSIIFGTVRQRFSAVSTTPGSSGQVEYSNAEQVPTLSGFLGLDWHPPQNVNLHVMCGYEAEYWWNVGRLTDPDIYSGASAGEFGAQGVQFRLEYNY